MKRSVLISILIIATCASCNKEKAGLMITGTVQQAGGCLPNTWLVYINSGNADQYSFLCDSPTPTSSLNCSNSVYIVNMPTHLSRLGKTIKFSRWKDDGGLCLSLGFAPHHLTVFDLTAE